MKSKNYNKLDVYHLIQPNFFGHYHFYTRRVIALRESGLNAFLLSFVDKSSYEANIAKYHEAEESGLVKLIVISNKKTAHYALITFAIKELVKGRSLVFHTLKFNANILLLIKDLPVIYNRIKVIYEFEGDRSSEYSYVLVDFNCATGFKKIFKVKDKLKANLMITLDTIKVKRSNRLILMSQEHRELWDSRTNGKNTSFLFPSLPEKERIYFCPTARKEVRSELKLENKIVLIYTGNILCKWQRLEDMCNFVFSLSKYLNNIAFLLLVPQSNLEIAKSFVEKCNIEHITILQSVISDDIYKYLSAADLALFLRHNHTMSNIVTSGKLGEFLASGLPVISTGANASVINRFMENSDLLIDIPDSLIFDENFILILIEKIKKSKMVLDRQSLSNSFYSNFNMDVLIKDKYPNFVKTVIG